jgi:surfeit locus 1 family protein
LHVLTPFRRADGGGVELIDRGWAPLDRRAPATRASGQLDGGVVVEGVVHLAAKPGPFTPDNEPQNNNWFFIEFDAMAKAAGVGSLPRYYIRATAPNTPGRFPVAHRFQPNLPNTHLAYAVTWYILAVALIAVYIVYLLRQREL